MSSIKKSVLFISIAIFGLLFSSCSKDDDSGNGSTYPKQVSVTYSVSSATTASAALVTYKNGIGLNVNVTNPGLPYIKTYTGTFYKNDVLSLGFGTNTKQTVKLEILVNNVSVKSQVFSSTSGSLTYLFE